MVGQLEKVVQHGADCVVLVAVPRRSRKKPRRSGAPAAAARYVDRRGGRAVDLEVRVARQGRELCGGLVV